MLLLTAIQPIHVLVGLACLTPFIVAGVVAGLVSGAITRRRG